MFGSCIQKEPVLKGLNSGASLTPCGNENNSIPVPSDWLNAQFQILPNLHQNVNAHLTNSRFLFFFDCGWFHNNVPAHYLE
jgi:hypothetical protein